MRLVFELTKEGLWRSVTAEDAELMVAVGNVYVALKALHRLSVHSLVKQLWDTACLLSTAERAERHSR